MSIGDPSKSHKGGSGSLKRTNVKHSVLSISAYKSLKLYLKWSALGIKF